MPASSASSEPRGPHISFPHRCSRKEGPRGGFLLQCSLGFHLRPLRMSFLVNVLPPDQAHMVVTEFYEEGVLEVCLGMVDMGMSSR